MMTNGPRIVIETTIRMCTRGNGCHGAASGRGEAGCIGTSRLSYRMGRKGARQMDTALIDGYPRRKRRQVIASYYTLLCISTWVSVATDGWEGELCREDLSGTAGTGASKQLWFVSMQDHLRCP